MTPERWQRVNEVLQDAWDREPGERAAFLDRACTDDPDLRSRVEALLASDEDSGEFFMAPLASLAAAALPEFLTGRRIGPYQIVREIGRGGMGAVYLAERADGEYRKQVAIKLIQSGLGSEAIVRRFRNERQVVAALDHPHIARLLDGGTTEDGLPYFVMEYVEGMPIRQWCEERKLDLRDRLRLFVNVCAAVQYAHENQVIHRDLKPANILVKADGTPKLLDFGIAKALDPGLYAQTRETTVHVGPMTPEYASPEQAHGDPVTPASDIYSLGVLLYELLTGHRPTRLERSAPSALAGDLKHIVLHALQPEPELRYASAADFAGDIGRYLDGRPVHARPNTVVYRAAKFLRRNWAVAGAALLIMILAMALVFRIQGPEKAANRATQSIAVLPLEDASHDPAQDSFVDGMTEALIRDLGQVRALRVISRDSVMRYKGIHKPLASTARELNVNALVAGSVLRSGTRVQIRVQLATGNMDRVIWSQTYDRDLQDVLTLQSDAAKAIAHEVQARLTPQEEERLSASRAVNRQAYEAYLRGRYQFYKRTQAALEIGIQNFKQALDIDPAYALAWAGLADNYYQMSSLYLPARQAMPMARAAVMRALAIDETLAEAHATLAEIQAQYDWNWTAAEKSYKRALELNPSYAQAHSYYSQYLSEQGRMEEALREAEEALRLDPLTMGDNLTWMYYLARRPDRALEQCRKQQALNAGPSGGRGPGMVYVQQRRFEEAIAAFLAIPPNGAYPMSDLALLGHAYGVAGRREDARRTLEKLLESSRQGFVDPYNIETVYLGLGEKDQAFEWFEKAYQERSEELLSLKVESRFDPVRADPRFKSLVRRLGLPP